MIVKNKEKQDILSVNINPATYVSNKLINLRNQEIL